MLGIGESQLGHIIIMLPCFNLVTSTDQRSSRLVIRKCPMGGSEVSEVHFIIGKRIRSYPYDQNLCNGIELSSSIQKARGIACLRALSGEMWLS